jgi:thioredoxin 1
MLEVITRWDLLLLLSIATWQLVVVGKCLVEKRRQQARAATPVSVLAASGARETTTDTSVRILSFRSENCHQCKRLQAPALERLLEARPEGVTITEVDATSEHELTQAYRVLTVPSTVVLDTEGHAHAINYGFANTQLLLTQVDQVLAKVPSLG